MNTRSMNFRSLMLLVAMSFAAATSLGLRPTTTLGQETAPPPAAVPAVEPAAAPAAEPAATPAAEPAATPAAEPAKAEPAQQPAAEAEKKAEPAPAEKQDKPAAQETKKEAAPAEKSTKETTKSDDDDKRKRAMRTISARTKRGDKVRFALLTLKDSLPESSGQVGPFGETQLDLREAVNRLEKAAKDRSITGVVLDIQNPSIGRGKVDELRGAIARVRKSGKKVYATLEMAMPSDYLVACACDEIAMPESGIILLPGIHAEATFYKGLLAKLGVEAEFFHIGDYKGAAEPMTREKFSEPVRENMNALIDSMYDDMVTTIVKDRPLSISQAKEIIDTGLITAKKAKDLGLIDRVAYPETLRDDLAKIHDADPLVYVQNYGQKKVDTDFSGPMGLIKLLQAMMGADTSSRGSSGKKIAVVYAVGPITTGKSEGGLFGEVMGSTTIVEALREANDDKQVAAIVLRIDSPGGSALASDLIWNQTQVIKKPIVASMGDVAGSGGYYIAMGTDRILATPGTITGSIGVVGGKMAIRGLYDKLGITTETIERGKNSGLFSSSGKWSESQREVVRGMMEDVYDQFTTKAAEGRKMPVEELRKLAGGRIYSGRQAKEVGLIDELGTLDDAIEDAKELAGLDEDADVKIEVLPKPTNFLESLFGDMDAEKEVRIGQGIEAVAPEMIDVARRAYRLRAVFDQPAALVMPFELEVR